MAFGTVINFVRDRSLNKYIDVDMKSVMGSYFELSETSNKEVVEKTLFGQNFIEISMKTAMN